MKHMPISLSVTVTQLYSSYCVIGRQAIHRPVAILFCHGFLQAVLSALNPGAKLITTTNSVVEPHQVLRTGLWSAEKAQGSAAWVQLLRSDPISNLGQASGHDLAAAAAAAGPSAGSVSDHHHDHHHHDDGSCCCPDHAQQQQSAAAAAVRSTSAYGVSHFVYRARWPFHPKRIHEFIVNYFVLQEPDWEVLMGDPDPDQRSEISDQTSDDPEHERSPEDPDQQQTSSSTKPLDDLQTAAAARRQAFQSQFGMLLRSKGFVWLATRGDHIGEWSQAGSLLSFSTGEGTVGENLGKTFSLCGRLRCELTAVWCCVACCRLAPDLVITRLISNCDWLLVYICKAP